VRHAFGDLGAIASAAHEAREASTQRNIPTNYYDLAAHRGRWRVFR